MSLHNRERQGAIRDTELTAHLPAFFRTLSDQKPSWEDMEKLLAIIKGTRRP